MPIIRRHAPTMKASITLLGTGTTIKHNRNITAVTGSTDLSDSLSFSGRMVLNMFFTGEKHVPSQIFAGGEEKVLLLT